MVGKAHGWKTFSKCMGRKTIGGIGINPLTLKGGRGMGYIFYFLHYLLFFVLSVNVFGSIFLLLQGEGGVGLFFIFH